MPSISSPLGNRAIQGNMREFSVPDDSQGMMTQQEMRQVDMQEERMYYPASSANFPPNDGIRASIEDERRIAEHRRMGDRERLSDGARKRIEMLCGMTRLNKEVEIDGNVFVLKTLKSKESREALSGAVKYDGTVEFIYELRRQILARSLDQIAGVDIQSFIGSSAFEAKLNLIDELDDAVVDKLYSAYVEMNNEIKQKYSINSDKEVNQTLDEIKK